MTCDPSQPAALVLFLSLAACSGGSSAPPVSRFQQEVVHTFFPLDSGIVRVYAGEVGGEWVQEDLTTLRQKRKILDVECTGIMETQFVAGELAEIEVEWYAQDWRGDVWKFGEEGWLFDGERIVVASDSWLAGESGREPWIALPGQPVVGGEFGSGVPSDRVEIISLSASCEVPAGTYHDCMEVLEGDVDDPDIILYAPGVGRVSSTSANGRIDLQSVRRQ